MATPARHFANLSDADKLVKAKGALDALETEPEIVAAMSRRRYTPDEKLAVGRARLKAVHDAMGVQSGAKGERLEATAAQDDALEEAEALYGPLAVTARVVFRKRRAVRTALGLTGEHGDSYGERIERMRLFVREARQPERLVAFTDEGEFDDLTAAVDGAEREITRQDRLDARAQHATTGRQAAVAALVDWVVEMQGHARILLRGKAQLLEMLGIARRR